MRTPTPFQWTQLQPTTELTRNQIYYLLVWMGIGSALLDTAIVFGIQTAIFKDQEDPYFWKFPGAIAGNAVVTLLVTVLLTWLIVGILTSRDVKRGSILPISPVGYKIWPSPPSTTSPRSRFGRWFIRSHGMYWTYPPPPVPPMAGKQRMRYLPSRYRQPLLFEFVDNVLRSLLLSVVLFCLTWPLLIAITNPIWGNHGYGDWPVPELIIAVYAGIVGFLASPIAAFVTLTSIGERILQGQHQQRERERPFGSYPTHENDSAIISTTASSSTSGLPKTTPPSVPFFTAATPPPNTTIMTVAETTPDREYRV